MCVLKVLCVHCHCIVFNLQSNAQLQEYKTVLDKSSFHQESIDACDKGYVSCALLYCVHVAMHQKTFIHKGFIDG